MGQITIKVSITNNELQISVSDTGPGIPPEDQERVLEKFEQGTGNHSSGVGLGLSLVKSLIELHRGRMEIHSELDKGNHSHLHFASSGEA